MLQALVFASDTDAVVGLSDVFREAGFALQSAGNLREARRALLRDMPDVALIDYDELGKEGIEFLENSQLGNIIELVLLTADPKVSSAVRGMRMGASDYFAKPVDPAKLRALLERVAAAGLAPESAESGVRRAAGMGLMHGDSPPMRRLYTLLRKVAPTGMTVLLCGESGVGKELAAQAIHRLGDRPEGPLVPVNCGAISSEILESELFGHEKGSFTGANRRHIGLFERASGGTLFLDEIIEMSADLQVKLLRALESKHLRRVGGTEEIPVDVRVVAATNQDPDEAVEAGRLREDLYYRLAQFPIRVPPLRERGDDITLLAEIFLAEFNHEHGVTKSLSPRARELLRLYSWPGNVRELRNAIARAHVLAAETVEPEDLPSRVIDGEPADRDMLRIAVGEPLAEVERRAILATVAHYEGDRKAAATALGITPRTLYSKLKKYQAG